MTERTAVSYLSKSQVLAIVARKATSDIQNRHRVTILSGDLEKSVALFDCFLVCASFATSAADMETVGEKNFYTSVFPQKFPQYLVSPFPIS